MMSASQISAAIRMKKKKMMEASPEIADTSPVPDLNAQDVYDLQNKGRIEDTLNSPKKINADETMMNESYDGVGISPKEKADGREAVMRSASVPSHPVEIPEMEAGGMVESDGDLSAPDPLLSKEETDESGWNKEKFKRLGRLSSYLDSLDI